jgi:hypothetical protein
MFQKETTALPSQVLCREWGMDTPKKGIGGWIYAGLPSAFDERNMA